MLSGFVCKHVCIPQACLLLSEVTGSCRKQRKSCEPLGAEAQPCQGPVGATKPSSGVRLGHGRTSLWFECVGSVQKHSTEQQVHTTHRSALLQAVLSCVTAATPVINARAAHQGTALLYVSVFCSWFPGLN